MADYGNGHKLNASVGTQVGLGALVFVLAVFSIVAALVTAHGCGWAGPISAFWNRVVNKVREMAVAAKDKVAGKVRGGAEVAIELRDRALPNQV